MKKLKKIFTSIYVRFVIIFIIILILSNFLSFMIITYTNMYQMQSIREFSLTLSNDMLPQVVDILRRGMLFSTVISSVFIVIVIYKLLKPIKRISNATTLVANGNFDIEVKQATKRSAEISELVNNFNKMTKNLKNNEYLRKDFVSSVSHEIKTPITAINGYAELLKDNTISKEKKEEYIDIILSESKRLTNLSVNLLKLSELNNQIIYSKKEFSLDEQIRRVVLLLQNKWEQKNIEIGIDLNKVKYVGDEGLFELVWINLIGNAIKFTNEKGKIFIKLNVKNNKILVAIQDTGVGISKKDEAHIFEQFYIADKSRNKESTGLGLSIVQRIIALSDGKIHFESQEGIGTTFFIELEK